MRLGLDFGTTNSAVALYNGEHLLTLDVDPANDNPQIMPSLLYIERSDQTTAGAAAATAYLDAETGRPVNWVSKEAGEMELTVASWGGGPIEYVQKFNVLVDEAANGRLFQSIKRALFNNRYEGTQVFDRYYRVDDLIALVLGKLKRQAEKALDQPCERIVMGRPVSFSDNPAADSRAEAILLRAAHLAGFTDMTFALEPVGVAHLHHLKSTSRQIALVFDFGGGTLDLTIAQIGGKQPPEILASRGVRIGGDDLDRRIMASLLPYFGGGDDGQLPPDMNDKLLAWHSMPELSQPHFMERILTLKRGRDPEPIYALETLVTHNLGFKLFKEIQRVKQVLSFQPSEVLRFQHGRINLKQTITRRRFERLISDELSMMRDAISDLLLDVDLCARDVDVVLRTGGSSRVPAVRHLLTDLFDNVQDIDPLVSVVGGFAVAAYDYTPETIANPIREHTTQPLTIGMQCYTDRAFVVDRVPTALRGLSTLYRANNTEDAPLTVHLSQPSTVYIAHEFDVTLIPDWLRAFDLAPMTIEIVDEFALIKRVMRVYKQDFPAGEVELGFNGNCNGAQPIVKYLVMTCPR